MINLGAHKFGDTILSETDVMNGSLPPTPRFRVNRTAQLTLSQAWQRIDFNGTSSFNLNSFPLVAGQSYKTVDWDAVNKLFKFNSNADRNYVLTFNYKFAGGLRPASVLLRFVIPAPSPVYFPFPETDKCTDLVTLESINDYRSFFELSVYANASMRQYGLGIELKTVQNLVLSPIILTEAINLIYAQ